MSAVGGYGWQVVLVVVLVLLNAAFSGSEMALISLRESQLQRLEKQSRTGRTLAKLARDPNRFLATIQIGITLAGFLASAAAAVSLAQPLIEPLSFLGGAAEPVSIILVTIVLTFFTLVVGELAPKRIAMQRAEGWAMLVARPLDILATLSRPVVWLLGKSTDLVVRLAGGDPSAGREEVSTEEIRDMVAAQQDITAEQRTIISGAFEIADRILREILVPRRDVLILPAGLPATEGLARLVEAGHSRAPVTGPMGLDDVLGVVHLRDLIAADGSVSDHMFTPLFLPETLKVSDAMRQLRLQRQQFAMVVDERGAIDGIVTMEDLVEEVVGEIYDETDRDVQSVIHEDDGAMLLPGTFPIHDLPDIGVEIEETDAGDYTTVAGMILARLGHIPTVPGETVRIDGHTAEVVEITGRAITRLRLRSLTDHRSEEQAQV
ncbi:putative hemolysin [Actinoplanes campanulatus]|uniref:Putative hemolysin n=1 Tax=Actinoplanes campanulatus TaxID=113559 RepID=A0A7W5ACX8_9ACTN|nr:hemolysin family protein [Actinoplanes campanulatus]MBB3093772.1 putative hemolysin [Actinoplanes campanulatus]GGN05566.1 membrane protein [Actinoplanes campanulatus]GID35150.1 membrane protein [Actinoplanes campanulatus]